MCEGYDDKYRQRYGKADRTVILKSGIEVRLADIPDYFKDEQAIRDLIDYRTYKCFGFPRANWGECPARTVKMVMSIKELYHPDVRLF